MRVRCQKKQRCIATSCADAESRLIRIAKASSQLAVCIDVVTRVDMGIKVGSMMCKLDGARASHPASWGSQPGGKHSSANGDAEGRAE